MKKERKRVWVLALMLSIGLGAWGQMCHQIDTTTFLIGEQTTLISYGPEYPTMDKLRQHEILPLRQWFDTIADANGKPQVRQLTVLTCFEVGEHWLKFDDTDSVLITVNDVPNVDTASLDIKDIATVMREPYTFWEIFRWVLLAIGVAALVLLVIYISKKIKRREPIITLPKAPPVPANQQALQDLEALRQRQLWQQGKVKEYHTELTDILRQYLFRAAGINSIEMTSDQTLEAFNSSCAAAAESREQLRGILQTADMVKFAKSSPQPYEHDRSMEQAKQFVSLTWTQLQPATEPKEEAKS